MKCSINIRPFLRDVVSILVELSLLFPYISCGISYSFHDACKSGSFGVNEGSVVASQDTRIAFRYVRQLYRPM